MIKPSKTLFLTSLVFIVISIIFLLIALFAPLSYDGKPISAPETSYYISKAILYFIVAIYLILSLICLLIYLNRRLSFINGEIKYVNFIGVTKSFEPLNCEIKVLRARFDLFSNQKKVCTISFLNEGDIFKFIEEVQKSGATISWFTVGALS